jgi:hypothetical protein
MFGTCETTDFVYPMTADIYYPTISQDEFGKIIKTWNYNKTIVCNATTLGGAGEEEIKPENFLKYEHNLISRTKSDIRTSATGTKNAATNILITNIKNNQGVLLYKEAGGARSGLGSLYEIATLEPFIDPFGNIQYYRMLWRKTDNQVLDFTGEQS